MKQKCVLCDRVCENSSYFSPCKKFLEGDCLVTKKRKINKKHMPPDLTAIKMLIEIEKDFKEDFSSLSSEDIVARLNKLIEEAIKMIDKT